MHDISVAICMLERPLDDSIGYSFVAQGGIRTHVLSGYRTIGHTNREKVTYCVTIDLSACPYSAAEETRAENSIQEAHHKILWKGNETTTKHSLSQNRLPMESRS